MRQLYWDREGAFSPEECDRLIARADAAAMERGTVYGASGYSENAAVRQVETSWHPRGPETAWFYDRLDALFAEAGEALGAPVRAMGEDIQIMRYGPGCHFQMWHSDAGYDQIGTRLISVSVELSDEADYDGGNLEIVPDLLGRERTMGRGGARFFFSQALHRVTPVTRGIRYALVNWTGAA